MIQSKYLEGEYPTFVIFHNKELVRKDYGVIFKKESFFFFF